MSSSITCSLWWVWVARIVIMIDSGCKMKLSRRCGRSQPNRIVMSHWSFIRVKWVNSSKCVDCKFINNIYHSWQEREEDGLSNCSIFGGAKATQEADNVLIIQDKRLTDVRGKKFLQVTKNRFSGDLGVMVLEFNKESLSYSIKPKKKIKPDISNNESSE